MNGEIAAGRLLAPWFGASTTTWAMLIGSVLSCLAIGHLVGGRLSRGGAAGLALVRLLAGAAVLAAVLPRVAPTLLGNTIESFHRGEVAGLLSSAALASVLVGLPMVLLGAASPLILHLAAQRHAGESLVGDLGSLAGRYYAAGTLGSLLGTFAAGLVLLPWLGTRHTFDVEALALVAAALLVGRLGGRAAAGLVAGGLLLVALPQAAPAAPLGRLIWSGESRYNHLAVVELGGQRQLRVNEGYAVQSFAYLDGRLPVRDVWSYYALAPTWSERAGACRVLLLGLGGGTAADIFRRLYPDAEVTGVELDAAMVEAGRRWLGVDTGRARVVIDDARQFVAADTGSYDVIILDAFQFPYVPYHLATREFFALVARRLAPGGVLLVNAGRMGEHREVVDAIAATVATAFPYLRAAEPVSSNTILVATRHEPGRDVGTRAQAAHVELERLAASVPPPSPAHWPADAPVMTDDRAPIEWLTDRIMWKSFLR